MLLLTENNMIELFIIGIYLIIASYSDFKTREVPDILSFTFIALGIMFNLARTIIFWDISYIAFSIAGSIALIILSLILFYGGQWGGGDAKLLIGIGAWYGITLFEFPKLITFLVNMLIFGAVYGVIYAIYLALSNRSKIKEYMNEQGKKLIVSKRIIRIAVIIMIISAILLWENQIAILFFSLAVLMFFGFYALIFVRAIESKVLIKTISITKLTEGDWVLDTIKKGKTVYFTPKKTGVSKQDIILLQKLHSQKIIKEVKVKDGIPFIPSFLIAFIITEIAGTWFLRILNL